MCFTLTLCSVAVLNQTTAKRWRVVHLLCIHVSVVACRLMNVVLWLHWAGTGAKLVYVLHASCTRTWIFDACTILAWYNAIHQTRCISAAPKRLLIYVSPLTFVSFCIALTVNDWGCSKTHWNTSLSRDWQYKNALYAAVMACFSPHCVLLQT